MGLMDWIKKMFGSATEATTDAYESAKEATTDAYESAREAFTSEPEEE